MSDVRNATDFSVEDSVKDPSQPANFLSEEYLLATYSARHAADVPSFVGKGTSGAVIELERILDSLFKTPTPAMRQTLESLDPKKYKRLYRLYKYLQNAPGGAFKWASMDEIEKEALFGFGEKQDALTMLDRVIEKYKKQSGPGIVDLPPTVEKRLQGLSNEVDKQIARRPEQPSKGLKMPGVVEKGLDVGKAVGQKGLEVGKAVSDKAKEVGQAIGEKAKAVAEAPGKLVGDVKQKYDQFQQEREDRRSQIEQGQQEASNKLNNYLLKKTPFAKIYKNLPGEISRELDSIGLTPDSMTRKQELTTEGIEPNKNFQDMDINTETPLEKIASNVVLKYIKNHSTNLEI